MGRNLYICLVFKAITLLLAVIFMFNFPGAVSQIGKNSTSAPLPTSTAPSSEILPKSTKEPKKKWDSEQIYPNLTRFLLYSDPDSPDMYNELFANNNSISQSKYKSERKLKVLIHGFLQNHLSSFPTNAKNAYLTYNKKMEVDEEKRVNILVIDWGKLSGAEESYFYGLYYPATQNIDKVGAYIADFLIFLKSNHFLVSYDDVHVVGFSLGAHVSGVVGNELFRKTGDKIGRITGLDPAGPIFDNKDYKKSRLDSSDAQFVDVIHTNAGIFGTSKSSGHIDFYPNGGMLQPQCGVDFSAYCSHLAAPEIFSSTILDPSKYTSCKCDSWLEFVTCKITCQAKSMIGEFLTRESRGQGDYYFYTK